MSKVARVLLPVVVIALAVAATIGIIRSRPRAARAAPAAVAPTVVVTRAVRATITPVVSTTGVVRPARELALAPEVSGRVAWVSPNLIPGGRVKRGETVAKLDDRDLALLVDEARARVSQAELQLTLEKSQGEVAKRELALVGTSRIPDDAKALALREPQRRNAEVQLEAAKNALTRAELNLARATVRAPLDATVQSERAEVGQLAGPAATLASLIGTESAWVIATVPVDKLRVVRFDAVEGSPAEVRQVLATGADVPRTGRVARLGAELDADTRTAQVIVEIASPFDPPPGGLPLLPGAYVDVAIAGTPLVDVFAVPRVALVEGDSVWIVTDGDTLERRALEIVWQERDRVLASAGVDDGTRVVTTPLALAIAGMAVKVIEATPPSTGATAEGP